MPDVRKFLDLSTGHLPQSARDSLEGGVLEGVVSYTTAHGWFVYASAEPGYDTPEILLALFKYAQHHGCDYILFDSDAHYDTCLPVFDDGTDNLNVEASGKIFRDAHNEAARRSALYDTAVTIWVDGSARYQALVVGEWLYGVKVWTVKPSKAGEPA